MDDSPKKSRVPRVGTWWPALVLLLALAAATPYLIGPPCPHRVVMAAGSREGAYYRHAMRYQRILARDGVELVVLETSGAKENLQRLVGAPAATALDGPLADLAMFQGGAASANDKANEKAETLAGVYLEPLWVFARADMTVRYLSDLRGKRIAVGEPLSGTLPLATRLLAANGVTHLDRPTGQAAAATNRVAGQAPLQQVARTGAASQALTRWVAVGGAAAATALENGDVDAAMFVTAVHAPLVQRLMRRTDVRLLSFSRAAAYETRFRELTSVTLPQGAVDLAADLPATPVKLLAPLASVIARNDLHPAIVPLMMKAMIEVHGPGETLSKPGEFPSAHHVSFPMRDMARHYLQYGPSVLYRVLPFWVAAWVDRMKLLILPLFTLLLPALRIAPPVYRWRVRRRIYCWYGAIRKVDEQVRMGTLSDPLRARRHLDAVEKAIVEVNVPMGYMEEFFALRQNLDDVRRRLESHIREATTTRLRAAA
ncbi:MAG: hypothetical protein KDB14_33775 [Planctomycetales bacterium]|nr:hypothetical protein [Planctomycetales bacterium]